MFNTGIEIPTNNVRKSKFSFESESSAYEGTVRTEETHCKGSVESSEGKSLFVEK